MTATAASPVSADGPRTAAPSFAGLLRAESRRLLARRFTRIAVVLAFVGYLVAVGLIWHNHHRVTAADLAAATAQRDQEIADITRQAAQCQLGKTAEQIQQECFEPPTADNLPIEQYLTHHPLDPGQLAPYALAVGVATAMLAFLLAATFIGAEWSTRNLVAWLFWEPRRLRVMAAKLLVLLAFVLGLALLAQLAWFGTAKLLLHYRGAPVATLGPQAAHFWTHLVQAQLRGALLAVATALIGFGLASLMRNSAAALGVAFVYFAVVETVVRALNRNLQPYLVTTNIGGWIAEHGITVFGKPAYDPQQGYFLPKPIHISNLHGGVVLLVVATAITAAALVVFARRDLS
ncbi:MAG: hypothetical protein JO144_07975 [Actinobacteria bacterium]|nr:hypothetical protein [Actinomycetota bacterium]